MPTETDKTDPKPETETKPAQDAYCDEVFLDDDSFLTEVDAPPSPAPEK